MRQQFDMETIRRKKKNTTQSVWWSPWNSILSKMCCFFSPFLNQPFKSFLNAQPKHEDIAFPPNIATIVKQKLHSVEREPLTKARQLPSIKTSHIAKATLTKHWWQLQVSSPICYHIAAEKAQESRTYI